MWVKFMAGPQKDTNRMINLDHISGITHDIDSSKITFVYTNRVSSVLECDNEYMAEWMMNDIFRALSIGAAIWNEDEALAEWYESYDEAVGKRLADMGNTP